jgi:hypothetical protein
MKRQRARERDEAIAREQAEARAESLLAQLRARQSAAPQPVSSELASPGEAPELVETEGEAEPPGPLAAETEPPSHPTSAVHSAPGGDPMGDKVPKRPPKPKKPKKPKA